MPFDFSDSVWHCGHLKSTAHIRRGIHKKKITYIVCVCVVLTTDFIGMINPTILESYEGVAKLKKTVESLPEIAKWIKERPQTDH